MSLIFSVRFFPISMIALLTATAIAALPNLSIAASGVGEVDAHISSERAESAGGTASLERHLKLGFYGGAISEISETDSLTFGGFLKTDRGFQAAGEFTGYGLGLYLGWLHQDFSMRFAYTLAAEVKNSNGIVETTFRDGSGIELQAKWVQWFGTEQGAKSFGFGPSLTYERLNFSKARVGSLPEVALDRLVESISPGVSATFIF
jgi:hypothetical protein